MTIEQRTTHRPHRRMMQWVENRLFRIRLSTLLIWSVSIPTVLSLLALLVGDYRREVRRTVSERREKLSEKATAIHQATLHLADGHKASELQDYMDAVRDRMQREHHHGHIIAVESDGHLLVSPTTLSPSEEPGSLLSTLRLATETPSQLVQFRDEMLVVGSFSEKGLTVYVSEPIAGVRRVVWERSLWYLGALAALGIMAAVIVTCVLQRAVVHPVRSLADMTEHVRNRRFEARLGDFKCREMDELARNVNSTLNAFDTHKQKARFQMRKAKKIQEHLLPKDIRLPGADAGYLVQPVDAVGGDYFDVIQMGDGSWLICVADVMGHGVSAALEATMLKTFLCHAAEQSTDVVEILRHVNRRFLDMALPEDFATLIVVRWVPQSRVIEVANAGHVSGLLQRASDGLCHELAATGLPLGIQDEGDWKTETIAIVGGECLLLVSDGVTETQSPCGRMFGGERLAATLAGCHRDTSQKVVGRVNRDLESLRAGSPITDDMTIVAVRFDLPTPTLVAIDGASRAA